MGNMWAPDGTMPGGKKHEFPVATFFFPPQFLLEKKEERKHLLLETRKKERNLERPKIQRENGRVDKSRELLDLFFTEQIQNGTANWTKGRRQNNELEMEKGKRMETGCVPKSRLFIVARRLRPRRGPQGSPAHTPSLGLGLLSHRVLRGLQKEVLGGLQQLRLEAGRVAEARYRRPAPLGTRDQRSSRDGKRGKGRER